MSRTGRCLVIVGNPSAESLGAALASAYMEGVRQAGGEAELLALGDLDFDPVLRGGKPGGQPLEPDLLAARASIERADHVTWVFPVWWGSTPAVLKGFVDRTFLPGWAFNVRPSGMPEGLLAGRSATMLVTMDAPGWFDRIVYGRSARRAMGRATLWYTGFSPIRSRVFPLVHSSTPKLRERWLQRALADGQRDAKQCGATPIPTAATRAPDVQSPTSTSG